MESIRILSTPLNGIKQITADGWDGSILQMSRDAFLANSDREELHRPAVYVIYADHFDKQANGSDLYVGQSDKVSKRLKKHSKAEPFWNQVLMFTANWMNVAHSFNIERDFIAAARLANRYNVTNDNDGQAKMLCAEDLSRIDAYVRGASEAANLANIDIFSFNQDGLFIHHSRAFGLERALVAKVKIASFDPNQAIVLEGSEFRDLQVSDAVLAAANVDASVERDGHNIRFKENARVMVDTTRVLETLLSISLTKFISNSGLTLRDVFRRAENGANMQPVRPLQE